MQKIALSILLCFGFTQAVFLRNLREKPEAKIKHLVQDIEESVSKDGEDAEMVFSSLSSFDGQVDTSLKKEISTLNKTLASLVAMQALYKADLSTSQTKVADLGTNAHDSGKMATKYQADTAMTSSKFEELLQNVQMLIALTQDAHVTPQGTLLTPEAPDAHGEPARVYTAIRRLMRANPALQASHPEAYAAFLPAGVSRFPPVHMTQTLLKQTTAALVGVKKHLESMESMALVQFGSLHRRFEGDAVTAAANGAAQQGVEAENEQKAAELAFSVKFTKAVLKIDNTFGETAAAHSKSNTDLIYAIRDLREAQLKILHDLSHIFNAEGSIAETRQQMQAVSFLEGAPSFLEEGQKQKQGAALVSDAEAAIHNHGDTHAILEQAEKMIDDSQPEAINADSVRDTMSEFQSVFRSVEESQPKLEETKRGCESQKFHAKEQEEGLKANFALMSAAHDHAKNAIKAAETNVQGIEKKSKALQKSSQDFSRISAEAIKSLEQQSKDRKTISMAVQKAMEVIAPVGPSLKDLYSRLWREHDTDPATAHTQERLSTVQLMKSLSEDMSAQEAKESTFRDGQERFKHEFMTYVQDYTQLLEERRRHYEASLGVLQLHVSELASDLEAQQQLLGTGQELSGQSADLCESVLRFYERHTKLRTDLSSALKSIVPGMSTALGDGAYLG